MSLTTRIKGWMPFLSTMGTSLNGPDGSREEQEALRESEIDGLRSTILKTNSIRDMAKTEGFTEFMATVRGQHEKMIKQLATVTPENLKLLQAQIAVYDSVLEIVPSAVELGNKAGKRLKDVLDQEPSE